MRNELGSEELSEIEQYATGDEGYGEFLNRIGTHIECGDEVKIGVESTGNTRFFKERMESAGAEVVVIEVQSDKRVGEEN